MKTLVWKKGIINTLGASGANIGIQVASGSLPKLAYICDAAASSSGATSYTWLGGVASLFPPIPYGQVVKIEKLLSVAEVRQIAVLGVDTETITASTRYKLLIGNQMERQEGAKSMLQTYAYTSPAVLSGNAATDRANVYTVLAAKINDRTNFVTAYLMYKVAFTLGSSTGDAKKTFVVGTQVTQSGSSVTAYVAAVEITSGTFAGDDAAGSIYLYNFSDVASWDATAQTLTGVTQTTEHVHTAAAVVVQGIVIRDDAGYYPSNPSVRRGPSTVMTANGFTAAHVDVGVLTTTTEANAIGLAGVVSMGQGAHLLTDVPNMNVDKTDYASGDPSFQLNAVPDATKTYTQLNIHVKPDQVREVLEGNELPGSFIYTLWIQEDGGLTNHATFLTALATATGVTPA